VYHRIEPHAPLLKLRPAKSIPFLSCHLYYGGYYFGSGFIAIQGADYSGI